jgi:hypothetical protein
MDIIMYDSWTHGKVFPKCRRYSKIRYGFFVLGGFIGAFQHLLSMLFRDFKMTYHCDAGAFGIFIQDRTENYFVPFNGRLFGLSDGRVYR